jgi:hypothetical protein
MFRKRRLLASLAIATLVFAACAKDDDEGSPTTVEPADTTDDGDTTTTIGELTDSFRGVTAESIKLGFAVIDYECIAPFVDNNHGDQDAAIDAMVNYVNDNGGILGRTIEPVKRVYCPIDPTAPIGSLAACTAFTEDDEVFAVLGVFIDFSGEAQLCLSRDHETVHIGHELEQKWIDEAVPGLMMTPDITAEKRTEVLLNLLEAEGTLDGLKVAVLTDQDTEARASEAAAKLEDMGLELGSTAVLTIIDEDTAQAQTQLDSFIEKWNGEDIGALFIAGGRAGDDQFVTKIKDAFPDLVLLFDMPSAAIGAGQDAKKAGISPNPFQGALSAEGLTGSERWAEKNATLQMCVDIYEDATGETLLGPDEVEVVDDKRVEQFIAVTDFCGEIWMFKQIAEAAGADLTNDSWIAAANAFGVIDLPTTDAGSICDGKYAADDAFRIVEFDENATDIGDWSPVTDIIDASAGFCG